MSEDKKVRKSHDWIALKKEFLIGKYKNLSDFKREKGISITTSVPFKGWIEEKKQLSVKALEAAKDEVVKIEVDSIAEVRNRQARLARFMQIKGMEKLKNAEVVTAEDARKLVVTGMQEERKVLGMEGGAKSQSLTQININPKTNLDKLLEGMDYEGVLGLIAEIKRERTRRALPEPDDESAEPVEDGEIL